MAAFTEAPHFSAGALGAVCCVDRVLGEALGADDMFMLFDAFGSGSLLERSDAGDDEVIYFLLFGWVGYLKGVEPGIGIEREGVGAL